MGDWIIGRLLAKEGTPTIASLTGKLIISDRAMIGKRQNMLLQSILSRVDEANELPRGSLTQANFVANFRQFVQIYIRTLRYASTALSTSEEQDLAIPAESLLKVINLLVNKKEDTHAKNLGILEEFIVLLLVPPAPFKNSSVDQVDFARSVLLAGAPSDELADAKQSLSCILACQNHTIAMKIFETKKEELDRLTAGTNPLSNERLMIVSRFWLHAAADKKVCARLQAEGLPVTLYNFMKVEDPKQQKSILKNLDDDLLKSLIELLLKLTAGHRESEQLLSLAMLEDI